MRRGEGETGEKEKGRGEDTIEEDRTGEERRGQKYTGQETNERTAEEIEHSAGQTMSGGYETKTDKIKNILKFLFFPFLFFDKRRVQTFFTFIYIVPLFIAKTKHNFL